MLHRQAAHQRTTTAGQDQMDLHPHQKILVA